MKYKDNKERTFGMEIEFADGDKSKIILPKGYAWTDNELTRMINSDGSSVTHRGNAGGEINTRPLTRSNEDLKELENFLKHLKDCGVNAIWNTGFDSHLYVKDLGVEGLKKIFELSYYIAPYLKKIFDIAEWFENKYVCPSPSYDYVKKVNRAETFEEIVKAFSNASHRGYIRFCPINPVPITKLGTIEFRLFNTSWDFQETMETIKFMFKFVEYAMSHSVEDYKKLNSIEKVIKEFNINADLIPKRTNPLLFAGEMSDFTTMLGKPERKGVKILTQFSECIEGKRILLANTFWLDIEQAFNSYEIVVYLKDVFMFSVYEVIKENRIIEYKDEFEFLNKFTDTKEGSLSCLIVFEKMKTMLSGSEFHKAKWEHHYNTIEEKIKNLLPRCSKIIERLVTDNIKYKIGDVRDAVGDWKKGDVVVYQNEFNIKTRSASNALMKFSDCTSFDKILTDYHNLKIENVDYVVFSRHSALGLNMVLQDFRFFLYSNLEKKKKSYTYHKEIEAPRFKKIPMNYEITIDSKIQFVRAKASELDYLRMMYLKKDILLGGGVFNYIWFIDGFCMGAMLFDFAKGAGSAGDLIWLKSDFVVNSNVKKLSKLLIMAIKKKDFQKELNAKYKTHIEEVTTNVFTDKPVSMKYRGVFRLHKRQNGKITYRTKLGKYQNDKELLRAYLKKL